MEQRQLKNRKSTSGVPKTIMIDPKTGKIIEVEDAEPKADEEPEVLKKKKNR